VFKDEMTPKERMAELEIALFDYLLEPVVKDFDDVDRLKPADPHRDGKLPPWPIAPEAGQPCISAGRAGICGRTASRPV